jgi:hypothetical protein
MAKIALGGGNKAFDSKQSRELCINMMAEGNKDATYRTIKRCDGLTLFSSSTEGPTRSNILVNGSYAYVVMGLNLYRTDVDGNTQSLGAVNGSGQAQIMANAVPGNNQICILNGSGDGYIYNNSGLTQITDPDFYSTTSGTVLNERFWFVRDGTNEVFGSDVSDGFSYNPLTFTAADESPDLVKAVIAKKSSLWILNETTSEFWQTVDDTTLPIRKVKSSTIERGIVAVASLAEVGDYFAFLADDLTVKLVSGNQMSEISDLDFNLKVRGNGTATYPGFTTVSDAIGFFVDTPTHKIYYITFPTEGYTWGYDLNTGMSHTRESNKYTYWRALYATIFNNKILMGDSLNDSLWTLDPASKKEGTGLLRATLRTPGISFDDNVTIPLIEVDMEVGQIEDPTVSPVMMVRYSKDGGYNWTNHADVELGNIGDYKKRVPIRSFGRLVRNKNFMIEFNVTDAVRVQFYGAWANIQVSM